MRMNYFLFLQVLFTLSFPPEGVVQADPIPIAVTRANSAQGKEKRNAVLFLLIYSLLNNPFLLSLLLSPLREPNSDIRKGMALLDNSTYIYSWAAAAESKRSVGYCKRARMEETKSTGG